MSKENDPLLVPHKPSRIAFIDGLRGIAVLMVVLSHSAQHLGPGSFKYSFIQGWVQAGDRGVQLFFILSAFTLFHSLDNKRNERKPILTFYLRRIFRLVPFWLIISLYWAIHNQVPVFTVLLSMSFMWGFVRFVPGFEFIPGGWTLFCEVVFYAFLPLIKKRVTNIYTAISLTICLLIMSDAWIALSPNFWKLGNNENWFFSPIAQFFAFGFGIIAYFVWKSSWFNRNIIANWDRSFLLSTLSVSAIYIWLRGDFRWATFSLFLVLLASLSSLSYIHRFASRKSLILVGRYSYSIYLLQFVVFIYLDPIMQKFYQALYISEAPYELRLLYYFPVVMAILIGASHLTYKYIETWSVNRGKRIIAKL